MNDEDHELARPIGMDDIILAIRSAAQAYGVKRFVVIGRGSLAATMPDSTAELRATMDIDLFPPWQPEKAAIWAAADTHIGRRSAFRWEHGFYVERVAEWTLMNQPAGWEDRAKELQIDDITAIVLHPLDLAYNKLEAGRDKDIDFMREGLASRAYQFTEVEAFIIQHAPDTETREMILAQLVRAQKLSQGGVP